MNFVRMAAKRDKSDTSPSTGGSPEAASTKAQKGQGAFDLWLNRGLHKLFDDVTSEPVPEELLRLIEEDRKDR